MRFIAINDGVDSLTGGNEFMPFKNIINEWYAKDISDKVKAVMRLKALNGDCRTGMPPYGYSRDPNNRTKLIPNERAEIVKMMYQWALQGESSHQISTRLNHMGLTAPRAEYMTKIGNADSPVFPQYSDFWRPYTVKNILMNPVYTGKIAALRTTTRSFKDKRRIQRPESEWIVTPNTHEALVSQEDYDTVFKRLSVKCRDYVENPDNIFRGLVICPDCGKVHGFSKRYDNRGSKGNYRCSTAVRYGRKYCSSHYITFEQLYELVLEDIQHHAALAAEDKDKYIEMLTKAADKSANAGKSVMMTELEKLKKRASELDTLFQKLYEDKVFGVISEERYFSISSNMENELAEIRSRINELTSIFAETERSKQGATDFAGLISKYTDIHERDYELVHILIEKIYIHEREIIDGRGNVQVDIYYRFIGHPDNNEPTIVVRKRGHEQG